MLLPELFLYNPYFIQALKEILHHIRIELYAGHLFYIIQRLFFGPGILVGDVYCSKRRIRPQRQLCGASMGISLPLSPMG